MKQTLKQALRLIVAGKSAGGLDVGAVRRCGLDGCATDADSPLTRRALLDLTDALPRGVDRGYTLREFVAAAYRVDDAGRYRFALVGKS